MLPRYYNGTAATLYTYGYTHTYIHIKEHEMTEQTIKQAPPCFTKEQTEALKRIVGMDEFYPNIWEVQQAGKIFKAEMSKLAQKVADGETSADGAINRAAVKVWSAARRYQSEKQAEQVVKPTAAAKAEPKGIKKLLHFLPLKRKGA